MNANDRQIGGAHYAGSYQHWDFVHDTKLCYHRGCATAYIARHRKKNGSQDLEKAAHFLQKARELEAPLHKYTPGSPVGSLTSAIQADEKASRDARGDMFMMPVAVTMLCWRFAVENDLTAKEGAVVAAIVLRDDVYAAQLLDVMLAKALLTEGLPFPAAS